VWGSAADPHAEGTLDLTNAKYRNQPIEALHAAVAYSNTALDLRSLSLTAGPARLQAEASLKHPPGDLQSGDLRFRVSSNRFQLQGLPIVQQAKAGLGGNVELNAAGAATLRRGAAPLFSDLQLKLAAAGISVNDQPMGDLNATARTAGNELVFDLNSNLGRADIRGSGRVRMTGDHPIDGQLTFAHLTWSGLEPLLDAPVRRSFDAAADGRITFSGPTSHTADLRAKLEVTTLQVHSIATSLGGPTRRNVEIRNAGPLVVTLDRSVVRIASAHLTGPYTDINVTGTAALEGNRALDLRAAGKIQLEAMEAFNNEVFSSGAVSLNAVVQGTMARPEVNGRLDLRNGSFHTFAFPNGISNANGSVIFTGAQAAIQNITGETGGGKVTLAGFVGYGGPEVQFRLSATADQVRVALPPNVSTTMNADLSLAGNTDRSLVSGAVTIVNVAFHSHTDVGSILNTAATPAATPQAKSPVLSGMRLDIRVETAPDMQVKTTLAQNIEAEAQLRVRGTASRPGLIGRVNVTGGEAVFFGAKYSIDQGSVTFTSPDRIDPYINIDLVTNVKGIDVQLSVSGPMDRLKLNYRSNPPMQFSELVSLLATGKIPTTDPVLAAREPAAPQQSLQQMGASAVLGQAVANPVSGRLERLFGITRLKIDPQIIGASNTPQARVTLEQQITRDLTFTYIQDVTQSNPQVIRVEWALDSSWSAILERDMNGLAGVDFFYKKRFR
jgi:translocation and assembly module TamB